MSRDYELAARKQAVADERKEARMDRRTARRTRLRKYRKCFWTWPFGHKYVTQRGGEGANCVGCGVGCARWKSND